MKNGNEAFCDVCGEDVGKPCSLYEHILAVLEDSAEHGVETWLDQKDREVLARILTLEVLKLEVARVDIGALLGVSP